MKADDRSSQPDEPAVPAGREPAAVAGEPSDDDLLTLDQLRNAWNVQADAANSWDELGVDEIVFWAQKQALARWGQPAAPPAPAEGEVGDALAARPLLEQLAGLGDVIGQQTVAQVQQLAEQAASWLQENPTGQPVAIEPRGCPTPGACSCAEPAPPAPAVVPVAASQRPWQREGWCDTDGRCWLHFPDRGIEPLWRLTDPLLRSRYHSHCLPAHAIPLPAPQGGEVEA